MGYGDLSCYGNKYIKTPNIDRLAATGTSFSQAYAGSGISSPSRCSLMTGRNTGNTRIRDNQCYAGGMTGLKINPRGDTTIVRRANLLPEDTTLATVIRTAGYQTCLVNKWHLDGYDPGSAPNHRGFHEFYGWTISTVHSNSPYYYPYYRLWGDSLIHINENAHDAHVRRYIQRGFTSLMFSFGCTGGQHRSVYSAQHLAEHLHEKFGIEVRICHREQNITQTLEAKAQEEKD